MHFEADGLPMVTACRQSAAKPLLPPVTTGVGIQNASALGRDVCKDCFKKCSEHAQRIIRATFQSDGGQLCEAEDYAQYDALRPLQLGSVGAAS